MQCYFCIHFAFSECAQQRSGLHHFKCIKTKTPLKCHNVLSTQTLSLTLNVSFWLQPAYRNTGQLSFVCQQVIRLFMLPSLYCAVFYSMTVQF